MLFADEKEYQLNQETDTYINRIEADNDYYSYGNSDIYDEENSSINGFSVSSHIKRQRKLREDYKRSDKGYLKLCRKINNKKTSIEAYKTSYTPDSKIRNACTGIFQNFRVGSRDEYMFYKVVLATGETEQEPGHLYYDNPEQYERHFQTTVPQEEKEKWTLKYREEQYNQMEMEKLRKIQKQRMYEHNYIVVK
jgi:hypothetical protein